MSSDIPINQHTNITDTIIQGYCKNKCKLRYNYPDINAACVMRITPDSQLNIDIDINKNTETSKPQTNTYLSITMDGSKQTPSVSFNGLGYNETEIRIYSPSLHMFNNKRADMEVCIYHKQVGGLPEKLLICVPFMKSTIATTATNEPSKMIHNIFSSHGGCYNEPKLTTKPFSLNTILPAKPYFYYKNEKKEHVVCFHTTSDNIIPEDVDLSILNRDIQSSANNSQQNVDLFFSGKQLSERTDDDIYIEYRIIDEEENVEENTEGFTTMKQLNNLVTTKNVICGLLIGGIVFSGYKIITYDKKKL